MARQNSVTDLGQDVLQMGKDRMKISRLQKNIDAKREEITGIYTKIGESYYFYHRNDLLAEERDRIVRINALNQEIEDLESQILLIQGYVVCPGCGEKVKAGSIFCSNCGYRIIPAQNAKTPAPDPARQESVVQNTARQEMDATEFKDETQETLAPCFSSRSGQTGPSSESETAVPLTSERQDMQMDFMELDTLLHDETEDGIASSAE